MTDQTNEAPAQQQQPEEKQPVTLRPIAGMRTSLQEVSDFDKLLATGEKLLRYQQERAIQAESEYQKDRTAIIDGCRVKMDRLKQQTEDELRILDAGHRHRMLQFERTIKALKGLREG